MSSGSKVIVDFIFELVKLKSELGNDLNHNIDSLV